MSLDYHRVCEHIAMAAKIKRETAAPTRIKVIQIESRAVPKARLLDARRQWLENGIEVEIYGYLDRAGNVGCDHPGQARCICLFGPFAVSNAADILRDNPLVAGILPPDHEDCVGMLIPALLTSDSTAPRTGYDP